MISGFPTRPERTFEVALYFDACPSEGDFSLTVKAETAEEAATEAVEMAVADDPSAFETETDTWVRDPETGETWKVVVYEELIPHFTGVVDHTAPAD